MGIATKLIELTALWIVVMPRSERRVRRVLSSGALIALFLGTAVGAWAGAFSSGDGGHHLGEVPPPGVLLPAGEDRPATPAEREAAEKLYEETVSALAPYADPAVAAAAGYNVEGMFGRDFHADTEAYMNDGHILDPHRPETLVYAVSGGRPVLLGAMFQMDDIGQPGPAIGGPLTVWHAHDHICFSLPRHSAASNRRSGHVRSVRSTSRSPTR